MDESNIDKLVAQSKSNDVDVKVDAVTKLQAEFETGLEITDPDPLISVLRTCVRHANQHLSTATLSALPFFLPLVATRHVIRTHGANSPTMSTSSTTSASHVDTVTLRQLLVAFLPAGGVIDRLGESREKARDNARQALVLLGGYAFRAGGAGGSALNASRSRDKGLETPPMIFERFLKDIGLGSKVWRVREQSMLALVEIRRAHHLFPIRSYLPLLIGALEDSDANVRECAKQSVVELFTGPAVTDAARADLKKEMTKKGVRKGIVDTVLSKVAAGGESSMASIPATPGPASENRELGTSATGKKEYIPPSMALMGRRPTAGASTPVPTRTASSGMPTSRPASRTGVTPSSGVPAQTETSSADVKPVYIASDRDLENEFAAMVKPYDGKESEHNWADRERAVLRVRGMLKGGVHERFFDTFISCLQHGFIGLSLKALASLRTTVAANTCFMYTELVSALGTAADPFCETLYTHLLGMSGFTKKIVAQQTQAAVTTLMTHTSVQPRLVVHLLQKTLQEKNVQSRTYAAHHIKSYIAIHGARSKGVIEASGNADLLDQMVKKALQDPNIGVREAARGAFWTFESVWSERAKLILNALDTPNRKNLEKACPDPEAAARMSVDASGSSQAAPKKSSVAAAIAASRAKARAIANAPPSLIHRATSTSHAQAAMRATSPPFGRAASPSLSNHSSDGGGRVASPVKRTPQTPPRSRILSTMNRSVSSSATSPPAQARQPVVHSPPSSPRTPPPMNKRRISSPLTHTTSPERGAGLRRATNTALPASPPTSIIMTPPTPRTAAPRQTSPRATIASVLTYPYHAHMRASTIMPDMTGHAEDESLLLATNIPVPEDSDSDIDMDMDDTQENLMSFSSPYEKYPPPARPAASSNTLSNNSSSQVLSFSPKSGSSAYLPLSNSLSSSSIVRSASGPIVEDALRARAEQAQSAAERLLELVDSEEDGAHHSPIPASLLNGGRPSGHTALNGSGISTPKIKAKVSPGVSLGIRNGAAPSTPVSKNSAIMRQAALFRDSPANKSRSASLMDVLNDRRHESGWWLKRMSVIQQSSPLKAVQASDRVAELVQYISALESGSADARTLQKLALLCVENPIKDPLSPSGSNGEFSDPVSPTPFSGNVRSVPSLHKDLWTEDKHFDRLFDGLMRLLTPTRGETELEYGLIVLWELQANQASCLEGREAEIFTSLLRVRACNKLNVLEATNTIRDALTSRTEPVYGLTTIHGSLRAFQAEPPQAATSADTKASTVAFGLIALGQFILRLPAEILEDELPRLKGTLISALGTTASLVVRESAAAAIVAAQLVLRDEAHLFALLEGLPDEKKNLLTYLFDKHGARGAPATAGPSGVEKLQKEMRRLDTRTSTPPRPRVLSSALA